jgi:hypothetical protein
LLRARLSSHPGGAVSGSGAFDILKL